MSEFNLSEFSEYTADIVDKAAPVLGFLRLRHRRTISAIHWKDGLFVTAEEETGPDEEVELTLASGQVVKAEIAGRDASTGIALLKTAETGLSAFPAAKPVRAGNLAIAAGRSADGATGAFGSISEAGPAWRSMRGGTIDRRITLGMALGGRFEGGAALDSTGSLIGMILFGPRRRALVIPYETIARVVPVLTEKGYVARGYLGAGLHPVRHGEGWAAMVMSLDADGPAKKAGLHQGDIIIQWNGEKLEGVRALMRKLDPQSVGQTVSLVVMRGGAEQAVELTVGARPHR